MRFLSILTMKVLPFLVFFSSAISGVESTSIDQAKKRIESFLKNQVPGLSVSYREVIDALISRGMDVYIRGGVTRDIFDERSPYPHDVDMYYSGSRDTLIAILDEHHWTYLDRAGSTLIRIGESEGTYIDASPAGIRLGDDLNLEEYTVNNIIYHCNTANFVGRSENGIEDIGYRRLRVLSNEWQEWVLDDHGKAYKRLFRFWKMVGKGFVYSEEFEHFITTEIKRLLAENEEEFHKELHKFLSKDKECFNDILAGCRSVMGYEWSELHMVTREELGESDEGSQKLIVHHLAGSKENKSNPPASSKLSLRNIFRFFK